MVLGGHKSHIWELVHEEPNKVLLFWQCAACKIKEVESLAKFPCVHFNAFVKGLRYLRRTKICVMLNISTWFRKHA